MPAKSSVVARFAVEERLDAILEKFDFFAVGGLLAEHLHPLGVGARAVFLVQNAGQNNDAQMGKFAAHNGQHLQSVHFRHAQVRDQQVKTL